MKINFFLFFASFLFVLSNIALAENYKLNIVDYPSEINIETGWTSYFNVVVMNEGDLSLSNVSINFDGEFPQWFIKQTEIKEFLEPKANTSFLVKLSLPYNLETKAYSFILNAKSKEATDTKNFEVRVFKTKKDLMLYQVQKLELEIEEIEKNATEIEKTGKNVTGVINVLIEARDYLEDSKSYINLENYDKVNIILKNVENLIKEAIFDLSIAPPKTSTTSTFEFPIELIIILTAISLTTLFIAIFYKTRKKETSVKSVEKIKEIITEEKVINPEEELRKLEDSRKLLEEEFKENLISKESYDELKLKYERRIIELRAEAERNKKII